VLRIL